MKRTPRLLALDLGRKTGWAHNLNRVGVVCGTRTHANERDALQYFESILCGLPIVPDAVIYEDVKRHIGTEAAHRYGGYLALLRAACQRQGVEVVDVGVGVGTIKKWATGKGNASKSAVMQAMRNRGYEPKDDNAADALALLLHALEMRLVEVGT